MNKLLIVVVVSALLTGTMTAVAAPTFDSPTDGPPLYPQAVYGDVTINGRPAPVGTVVEARGVGVRTDIPGNPITAKVIGKYGGPSLYDQKLGIQGKYIVNGTSVEFYVNGLRARVSADGVHWGSSLMFQSGVVSKIDLITPFCAPIKIVRLETQPEGVDKLCQPSAE